MSDFQRYSLLVEPVLCQLECRVESIQRLTSPFAITWEETSRIVAMRLV
jgi:hypothetical protein